MQGAIQVLCFLPLTQSFNEHLHSGC